MALNSASDTPPHALQEEVQRVLAQAVPSRGRRAAGWVLGLVALAALVAGGIRLRRPTPVHFKSEAVTRGDLHSTVTASGKLHAVNSVDVGAEISGKVLRVPVTYNDRVKAGEVLAEIDPEQLKSDTVIARAQVAVAEAAVKQAEATADEAKLAAARAETQAERGLVSQQALEAARAAWARAQASVASSKASQTLAQATLRTSDWKLSKAVVRSPIDGVVLDRAVEPGQTVTAGFTTPVLFTLSEDLSRLSLRVDVDEADVGHVREQMTATFTVDAFPGETFQSKVLSVHWQPKTTSGVVSYEAELAVDNGKRLLRPGMTATATVLSETHANVVMVPDAALRFTPASTGGPPGPPGAQAAPVADSRPGTKTAWVLDGDRPVPVEVTVGLDDGHQAELLTGALTPGQKVLTGTQETP